MKKGDFELKKAVRFCNNVPVVEGLGWSQTGCIRLALPPTGGASEPREGRTVAGNCRIP